MSVVFNKIWAKYDVNKDNKISREEFRRICYELGHYLDDKELTVAFTLIDGDGSGEIDRDEFLTFWRNDDRFEKLRLTDEQTAKLEQRQFLSVDTCCDTHC
jgi:hypothetical protein